MAATDEHAGSDHGSDRQEENPGQEAGQYLRFGAMIATSVIVMYGVMYLNTFEFAHVRWSETRISMALLMGATMTVVMLLYMLGMYRNRAVNLAILVGAAAIFALGLFLVRSQTTVQERSYMSAMIPHHSIAILTSERAGIEDVRVCRLAVEITEAQRREISEMEWLIDDIQRNGVAASPADAQARPVPEFEGTADRTCPEG